MKKDSDSDERRRRMALVIGRAIVEGRTRMGMTSEDLANIIGTNRGTISTWENGHGLPEATFLPRLATALRTTIDELLGLTPELPVVEKGSRLMEALFSSPIYNKLKAEAFEQLRSQEKMVLPEGPVADAIALLFLRTKTNQESARRAEETAREALKLARRRGRHTA